MLTKSQNVNKGWKLKSFNLLSTKGMFIKETELIKKNGLAVAFICNHCPYVKDIIYRMVKDFNELKKIDVGVTAIMPNDSDSYPEDSYENMIEFSIQNKFSFHYLYDGKQEVSKKYGAVCTPDFFCFDQNLELFYRGRLDNLRYQSKNLLSRKKELLDAFNFKITTGNIIANQNSSIGCSIKWKKNIT